MATFKIEWLEVKSPDWKIVSIKPEQGDIVVDVSVNKKDKNSGVEFPNFDNLKAGDTVEGEFWMSKAGKGYLFPPKQKVSAAGNFRRSGGNSVAIQEAQATKAKNIAVAQDRNALMYAKLGATDIIAHHPAYKFLAKEQIPDEFEALFTKIYNGEPIVPFN